MDQIAKIIESIPKIMESISKGNPITIYLLIGILLTIFFFLIIYKHAGKIKDFDRVVNKLLSTAFNSINLVILIGAVLVFFYIIIPILPNLIDFFKQYTKVSVKPHEIIKKYEPPLKNGRTYTSGVKNMPKGSNYSDTSLPLTIFLKDINKETESVEVDIDNYDRMVENGDLYFDSLKNSLILRNEGNKYRISFSNFTKNTVDLHINQF